MDPESTRRRFLGTTAGGALLAAGLGARGAEEKKDDVADRKPIRVGIVGLDTSHVTVFTKYLNRDNRRSPELQNVRVVAAFPAGNPQFPLSKNRLAGFTKDVRELGVQIVPSIEELFPLVDVVLLESVDGTQHLEQARKIFEAKKPVYIDKPLAASLKDCLAIAALGAKHNVPWFAASSSRFTPGYVKLRQSETVGKILGSDVHSQSRAAPGHPDLFWYGVHGVDLLYTLMGAGCRSVTAVQTQYSEFATGVWQDERVGSFRAIREHTGKTGLGATVFGSRGIVQINDYYNYYPLVVEIVKFFRTKKTPVPVDEMLEVFAFMAAAEESKRRQGVPVLLKEMMEQARA